MTTRSYLSIDPEHSTITSYSVSSKGGRAIVKVEIVVADTEELAWLVREIGRAQAEGKTAKPPKAKDKEKQPAVLSLPYFGDPR